MIHLYSGDGKGKTTAAAGLAVRAAGAGMRVYFFQFLKDGTSSEAAMLERIGVKVRCYAGCCKFVFQMDERERADLTAANNALLREAQRLMETGEADAIVLDEVIGAYNTGTIDRSLAEEIVISCGDSTELILTGRDPADFFCQRTDYHSIITAAKHPYSNGAPARKGIEF